MNEMDSLEKQLRSWTPRRPSAKVAARLFSRPGRILARASRSDFFRWLAPVTICFLTLLAVTGNNIPRANTFSESATAAGMATMMVNAGQSSNMPHSIITLSKADQNMEWNTCPQFSVINARFESTTNK